VNIIFEIQFLITTWYSYTPTQIYKYVCETSFSSSYYVITSKNNEKKIFETKFQKEFASSYGTY